LILGFTLNNSMTLCSASLVVPLFLHFPGSSLPPCSLDELPGLSRPKSVALQLLLPSELLSFVLLVVFLHRLFPPCHHRSSLVFVITWWTSCKFSWAGVKELSDVPVVQEIVF
jgi:hypothetical protein